MNYKLLFNLWNYKLKFINVFNIFVWIVIWNLYFLPFYWKTFKRQNFIDDEGLRNLYFILFLFYWVLVILTTLLSLTKIYFDKYLKLFKYSSAYFFLPFMLKDKWQSFSFFHGKWCIKEEYYANLVMKEYLSTVKRI